MPFKCCMGNNSQQSKNEEQKDNYNLINRIPKPIDLNEGYSSQLELLIFNNRTNNNQFYQGSNQTNNALKKLKYCPAQNFNINPTTFVETKVSKVVNTLGGTAIAETSSNIILSGCNSPIKLVTSIEATPKLKNLNFIEPALGTNMKLNQNSSNHGPEKKKSKDNNFEEKKTDQVEEINNFSENGKFPDQEIDHFSNKQTPLNNKMSQFEDNFEPKTLSKVLFKNSSIKNNDELNLEKAGLKKYIDNTKNSLNEFDFDVINKNNEKFSNICTSDLKNDINELIFLSKKLKNENNQIEKKKKKSKKSIHIEISFSPKNNIFVDAKHNQNENKNLHKPHNKFKLKLNDSSGRNNEPSRNMFAGNNDKNTFDDLNYTRPNGSDENIPEVDLKTNFVDTVNDNKYCENHESENEDLIKESIHFKNNNSIKEDNSDKQISSSFLLNKIEHIQKESMINHDSDFEEHSNVGINSLEKLIPFVDEPETKINYKKKIDNSEECKFPAEKVLANSLTEIKQPNNLLIKLSQEALEKLNGSLPVVESDPEMAQLFASAQIRIDDINEQNEPIENSKLSEESDPIDSIVKFLDDPSKYKESICWATIKAVKDVYEPQVEYAQRELERWMNNDSKTDESKENIEYYNNLIIELREKVDLAEKARELLLKQNKSEELQLMLDNEKNSLEEIKKKISNEVIELKTLEEKYLSGCIYLKEEVRASRVKIKNLEIELKSKLAEIHKLDELLGVHKNY